MLKVGLLCGVIAAMSAAGVTKVSPNKASSKEIDTRFIVELEDSVDSISKDEMVSKHDKVVRSIKRNVNANANKLMSYSVLNNAFVVTGNKEDMAAIKSIKGVKSVVEDVEHVVTKSSGKGITLSRNRDPEPGIETNESAVTMQKTDDTNEGEGTLIAILDNEFYLRGKHKEGENTVTYNHEVYTALPSGVKEKITFADVTAAAKLSNFHAKQQAGMGRGWEGSLYFNNKVPFYYDYAGDSKNGSREDLPMDYNVESKIGLHGSHVSSIASANADTYKGIAPKAQLALMKVFSDVEQTLIGKAVDPGNYSSFSEMGFLAALEDAVLLGADVINVSIGSDLDDFDLSSISMRTLEKLTDEDAVLTSISAGNGGKSAYAFTGGYGNWTRDMVETGVLGSFANNSKTMSIASGQPDNIFFENAFRIGEENVAFEDQIVNIEGQPKDYNEEFRIKDLELPESGKLEWVYVPGFGASTDYAGLNVTDKIAVVNRGSIDFSTKYANAAAKGAIALVIINNDPTANDFNFRCSFGDGFKPTMPCALVLFKDKPLFVAGQSGELTLISKQISENKQARMISDFSSDGARFDLDLKPEITTPGTNIRGAVWPQNKEEKETPYSAYEYLNGTSMAAPNYAGAVSLLVSKKAQPLIADGKLSAQDKAEIKEFRRTVDMRFMSTAVQMKDFEANGEDGKVSITSPRLQGAGMANIDGAYHTDVYLKGSDVNNPEQPLNRSKILLRNGEDIAKGDISLSFTAVNENKSALSRSYDAEVTIMRPATVLDNKIVSKDYNYKGEVSDLSLISGFTYAALRSGEYVMITNPSNAKVKDVIKIGKDLEYFESVSDANAGTNKKTLKTGYYFFTENGKLEELPNTLYSSVKDVVLDTIHIAEPIDVAPGEHKITLDTISLTPEQKQKIAEAYPYGTYIEGYVSLKAKESGVPNLSIPYLGFYSLTDMDETKSFSSAPVVEPFSFEKDKTQIYGSDLVNDVTKQLLGKSFVNFESMMLAGYVEKGADINIDKILTNDDNFARTPGFKYVGTMPDPYASNEALTYLDHPEENIYVGNAYSSNTMIVQQFVMRSVKENFFTIKNKATGEVVYKSALEDMLFGEQNAKYPLYKSHVDADYLGAGYVAHRAYAIIPLYNPVTLEMFASGEYELQFNYQLASTSEWINKTYTLHVDNEAPVVNSIINYWEGENEKVRITFKDTRVAYAVVGTTKLDVNYDEENDLYYVDVDKSLIDEAAKDSGTSFSSKRLYVTAVDYANGSNGAIVHWDEDGNFNNYTILQGYGITGRHDFKIEANGEVKLITVDEYYTETPATLTYGGTIITGHSVTPIVPYSVSEHTEKDDSNKGLILGLSIGGGVAVAAAIALGVYFVIRKRKLAK
mgnify:CR=1 FL=1